MRYVILAAAAAALLSTSAMAQDSIYTQPPQPARAYAPADASVSPAATAFPQEVTNPQPRNGAISEQDRLFLMQGDRGIGNG